MKFPGVLKKEHMEIERNGISRGVQKKTHVEFPWFLVFELGISKG